MYKLLRQPVILRIIAWCMLGSFLIMTHGCYYFRVHSSEKPYTAVIQKMQDEKKFMILHHDYKVWHLTDIKVVEKSVSGTISTLSDHEMYLTVTPDKPIRYRKAMKHNESGVLNEVHIYVTALEISEQGKVSIPADEIQKVEVYDKAKGTTIAAWSLVTASAVTALIAFLSSCPFIYTYNGDDYDFTGEIFSGAIQPGLERDDYLPLPAISSNDGTYRIKITNELKEIQSVNLTELTLVDHRKGTSVLIDRNGSPYSFAAPLPPVSAVTSDNTDILPLVKEKDSLSCSGLEGVTDKNGINAIVLKFVKPDEAGSAKLLIRAKNSMWMETVSAKVHELFGERFETFSAKREKVSGDKLRKWQFDQKLPLSVFIEKNNKWEFADYFNIAGPAALRDDILPLNLEGINSDTIKIKLETGFMFWEVDYTAMDFSSSEPLNSLRVPATTATTNNNLEIKEALAESDNSYYVLDQQGDGAILVFDNPELKNDCRSVFLHSRGYYKVLRDQTGPPDKKTLKTFRKPGRIPIFSKEMYDGLR